MSSASYLVLAKSHRGNYTVAPTDGKRVSKKEALRLCSALLAEPWAFEPDNKVVEASVIEVISTHKN